MKRETMNELMDELNILLMNDRFRDYEAQRDHYLKRIMRKSNNKRFQNSKIYYTMAMDMENDIRTQIYKILASDKYGSLGSRLVSLNKKEDGSMMFIDELGKLPVEFRVHGRNGNRACMIINNNRTVRIVAPSVEICNSDFYTEREFKVILYVYKGNDCAYDGIAAGSRTDSVKNYKRIPFTVNPSYPNHLIAEISYPEFIRIFMSRAFINASRLTNKYDVITDAVLIRTRWKPGDSGRQPEAGEELGSIYDRPIRKYTPLLRCVDYAEIVTPIRNKETKTRGEITVCRIYMDF